MVLALALVGVVLAVINIAKSKLQSELGWGLLAVSLSLTWGFWR
jgi:hypothetical protein